MLNLNWGRCIYIGICILHAMCILFTQKKLCRNRIILKSINSGNVKNNLKTCFERLWYLYKIIYIIHVSYYVN